MQLQAGCAPITPGAVVPDQSLIDPQHATISGHDSAEATGFRRFASALTLASAATILISIAVSQILMGAALLVSLFSGRKLRFPPIALPLLLFFCFTVFADLLSESPRAGVPQIRKFY